uniref:DUF4476 domain-containing protein n=2 Tax=Chrysotila carterae TaxID=13221 RepID=A0A7S4AYZ1_CHRCT|mmetsp:Transcript_33560/g.73645  ORF Transcript_33560/g.73645 Transcript_33560/m.73645 type:complete len:206 (+) Transcript_33560:249-866(+)
MDEESDGSNFLNFCYKNKRVELEEGVTIQTWPDGKGNVPETGVIFFDYSSGKRVPHEARPLREEVFQSFLRELSNPGLSEQSKLLMLRTAATTHFYNAEQVRAMVRLVDFRGRVDAVVMLFRRIVDLERFYELVYLMLKPSETAALRTRLGKALKPWLPESEMEVEQITEGTTAVVFLTEEVPADEVPADVSPESALTTEQPEQA